MILLKIFNVLCIGLILSTSIVDGKSKTPSKSGGSKPSSSISRPSTTNRQTTSRPMNKQTTRSSFVAKPTTRSSIIVQQTSRPLESSKPNYPTQPPYNPHYQPPYNPHYQQPYNPHNQPPYNPHYQPGYQPPKPDHRYPQTDYRPPHQNNNQYPSYNTNTWNNKPKKSNVGRNIATHAIAGLGGAYVGHQIGKHSTWYEKKRRDRQQEHERTHTTTKNRTNTFGIDRLKPITPFKVHDVASDPDAIRHETGNGFKMLNDVHMRYNNDPQKNEISKAAEANMYLNMKLRPSKSETIPKRNYTTEQLQGLIMSGGGLAMLGGALGAGAGGAMGMGSPAFGQPPNSFNPQPNFGGVPPPGVQPNYVQPGVAAVQPGAAVQPNFAVQPGLNTTTFVSNSTNPMVPQVPVIQVQPGQVAQSTNFTITGGQSILDSDQTLTPYKIPLADPQVLPLVIKQLDSDDKLNKKKLKSSGGSRLTYSISSVIVLVSMVVIKKFNY